MTIELQKKLPRYSTSKLPERYGLFTIIVLGETIAGTVNGMASNHHLTSSAVAAGVLGIVLGFSVWWIYFDFIARRVPKPGTWWVAAWGYLHLPLLMSLVAMGSGVLIVVSGSGHHALSKSVAVLLSGSVGTALIIMGLLEFTLFRSDDEPTHHGLSQVLKFFSGIATVFFGLFGPSLQPVIFIGLLMVPLLINLVYGLLVWFRQELPDGGN